jgi:hypothetical protein
MPIKYNTELLSYAKTEKHYIEIYTSIKRIVRAHDYNEERAVKRILKKEEDRKIWDNHGYVFVDCDYNIVEEKDYETYRLSYKKV